MTSLVHHFAHLRDVTMHYVTAGTADTTVVLLHGYPQSWFCWRDVIAELADEFRIVAPDLRGLGDTTRPAGGYDKRTIAADVHELLSEQLGLSTYAVAGHDWGGVVAFALAADHPDAVTHLSVIDVAIPGDGQPDIGQGGRRWHHRFLQTLDLPEALIGNGREHVFFDWFFTNYGHAPDAISPEARAEYLRTHTTPGALRAGFAYYWAVVQDVADNEARIEKLTVPTLTVGGGTSWGRGQEVARSVRQLAANVTEEVYPDCGHWVPEEKPAELAASLRAFIGTARRDE